MLGVERWPHSSQSASLNFTTYLRSKSVTKENLHSGDVSSRETRIFPRIPHVPSARYSSRNSTRVHRFNRKCGLHGRVSRASQATVGSYLIRNTLTMILEEPDDRENTVYIFQHSLLHRKLSRKQYYIEGEVRAFSKSYRRFTRSTLTSIINKYLFNISKDSIARGLPFVAELFFLSNETI